MIGPREWVIIYCHKFWNRLRSRADQHHQRPIKRKKCKRVNVQQISKKQKKSKVPRGGGRSSWRPVGGGVVTGSNFGSRPRATRSLSSNLVPHPLRVGWSRDSSRDSSGCCCWAILITTSVVGERRGDWGGQLKKMKPSNQRPAKQEAHGRSNSPEEGRKSIHDGKRRRRRRRTQVWWFNLMRSPWYKLKVNTEWSSGEEESHWARLWASKVVDTPEKSMGDGGRSFLSIDRDCKT